MFANLILCVFLTTFTFYHDAVDLLNMYFCNHEFYAFNIANVLRCYSTICNDTKEIKKYPIGGDSLQSVSYPSMFPSHRHLFPPPRTRCQDQLCWTTQWQLQKSKSRKLQYINDNMLAKSVSPPARCQSEERESKLYLLVTMLTRERRVPDLLHLHLDILLPIHLARKPQSTIAQTRPKLSFSFHKQSGIKYP